MRIQTSCFSHGLFVDPSSESVRACSQAVQPSRTAWVLVLSPVHTRVALLSPVFPNRKPVGPFEHESLARTVIRKYFQNAWEDFGSMAQNFICVGGCVLTKRIVSAEFLL